MKKLVTFGLAFALAIPAFAQTPPDGLWRGQSDGGQCNHGRPTYVELKLADIERLFGRR